MAVPTILLQKPEMPLQKTGVNAELRNRPSVYLKVLSSIHGEHEAD